MLKQTMLTFKGALGFITGAKRADDNDSDSGVSSGSQRSEEDQEETRGSYTSTCILVPAGQSLNDISVERQSQK